MSTKIHVRAESNGKLITFILTPGQQHEALVAEQLLNQGAVKRRGAGRPRMRPKRVAGDKGHSSRPFRQYSRRRGRWITIPGKKYERRTDPFDKELYRFRNQVERLINRLKQNRRVATRYEKRGTNYAAMVTIAAIWAWL